MRTSTVYGERQTSLSAIPRTILVSALFSFAAFPGWAQSAVRSLPDTYTPEQPVSVSIAVTPPADVEWYAIEYHPAGWTVSNITQGGNWNSSNNSIIWPSFLNGDMRTLTYEATPPVGETGIRSFDGSVTFLTTPSNEISITGDTMISLGLPKVATPTFDPDPSPDVDFSGPGATANVQIFTETPGATIRYTFGIQIAPSDPDESSEIFTGFVGIIPGVRETNIIKAKAWRDGWEPSDVATAVYYNAGEREINDDWLNTAFIPTAKIHEEVIPPDARYESSSEYGPLAVRLTGEAPIDTSSIWADIVAGSGSFSAIYEWRPVSWDQGDDGWVMVSPENTWPLGDTLTVTVGGLTHNGSRVGPVTELFTVSPEKSATTDDGPPFVVEEEAIIPLPTLIANAVSPVYRVGPSGVFDEPAGVWAPVPAGETADGLDIYYYSESERHTGWFEGENVDGWLVPNSTYVVVQDGQTYLYFEVNHSGVLQLARTTTVKLGNLASVDVGSDGSPARWMFAITVSFLLIAGGLRELKKKRVLVR